MNNSVTPKKVLVTGAGGFAGSHLTGFLLEQGHHVIALVSPRDTLVNLNPYSGQIEIQRAELRDSDRIFRFLQESRPERIYHLASLSSKMVLFDQPRLFFDVILKGTLNLLFSWRDLAFDSRFVFVSSAEVYGVDAKDRMPIREEYPFRPTSPYASSKAAAEMYALQFFRSYGLPIIRARPFQHTGPRQSDDFVCSNLARQVAEIELGVRSPRIVVGNTAPKRDFTDVRDVVRGYHLLLEQGELGDVYQLCSGRAVSIRHILETLVGMTSTQVEVTVDPSLLRSNEPPDYWGDPTKTRKAVGWEPQIPLEITLRDLKLHWESVCRSAVERHGL